MRENRYIARRSGNSSITVSMNCALPGAGPITRIAWLPVSSIISKESMIADHTVNVRMSTSWSIAGGRSALASSLRCCPILMATARAPMRSRICRASESGTMPDGAASSTSAAVLAAARRSLSRFIQKLAIAGT